MRVREGFEFRFFGFLGDLVRSFFSRGKIVVVFRLGVSWVIIFSLDV